MFGFIKKLFGTKPTVNPCPEAPYKIEAPVAEKVEVKEEKKPAAKKTAKPKKAAEPKAAKPRGRKPKSK